MNRPISSDGSSQHLLDPLLHMFSFFLGSLFGSIGLLFWFPAKPCCSGHSKSVVYFGAMASVLYYMIRITLPICIFELSYRFGGYVLSVRNFTVVWLRLHRICRSLWIAWTFNNIDSSNSRIHEQRIFFILYIFKYVYI